MTTDTDARGLGTAHFPITVEVLRRGPPRFNMVGQRMPDSLHDTDEAISPGLVKRLHNYGLKAMCDAGFEVTGWACNIYTMDAEERPSDRYYCVEFTNSKGGMLGVQGIAITSRGHPCLDHGVTVDIGCDPARQTGDPA